MSTLKINRNQLGQSGTATNNFTITAEAADGTMKIARGNAGATTQDILTVDAAGLVAAPQGSRGGLFLATAQATTSGTSIDFTSIPSWVKRITIMFSGVSTNGTSIPQLQIGSGSVDTAATYLGSCGSNGTATLNSTGFLAVFGMAAANILHGNLVLTLLDSTNKIWSCNGSIGLSNGAGASFQGGTKTLSGVLDRVRLTTVNGTDAFDAGSVNIMYEG